MICCALIMLQSCCRVAAKIMFSVKCAKENPWAVGVRNFFVSVSKKDILSFFNCGGIPLEISVPSLIVSPFAPKKYFGSLKIIFKESKSSALT